MNTSPSWPLRSPDLLIDADGVAHNLDYGDVYHSRSGALDEAHHVFVNGCDLPRRLAVADRLSLLEAGFGAGLNFLATWQQFLASAPSDARLNYVAVEKHPFTVDQLNELLGPHAAFRNLAQELIACWPDRIPGFHQRHFAQGRITLTLLFDDVTAMLPQLDGRFDAFYLDGFSPACNPAMWSAQVFAQLDRLAAPGASVATYSSARSVREGLSQAGFLVERRVGLGRKRHMLVGHRLEQSGVVAAEPRGDRLRDTVVVGAGIAGAATAAALARRGVRVRLFEEGQEPAVGGSGNPAGIVSPVMSRDWNTLSQLTGPAVGYTRFVVEDLRRQGFSIEACFHGNIRLARQDRHAVRQAGIAAELQPPPDFAQWLSAEAISEKAGLPCSQPGWLYPGGGWIAPRSVIAAWLAHPLIQSHYGVTVAVIAPNESGWVGLGPDGSVLFESEQVVLATAEAVDRLIPTLDGVIEPCRGQISQVPLEGLDSVGPLPRLPISREGYVLDPVGNALLFGASFKPGDSDLAMRAEEHEENRQRLAAISPQLAAALPKSTTWTGRVSLRATTSDRLPLVGRAPALAVDAPTPSGLYVNVGHGSRGLTWAALLSESLVAQMGEEPNPLSPSVRRQIAPARFQHRQARRARASGGAN